MNKHNFNGAGATSKLIVLGAMMAFTVLPAQAQQPMPQAGADAAAGVSAPVAGDPAALGALERRIKQLERQMIDLRTMFGTAQSLRSGGGGSEALPWGSNSAGAPVAGGGDDGQVQALRQQVNRLARRLERLEAGRGGDSPDRPGPEAAPFDSMGGMNGMSGMIGRDAFDDRGADGGFGDSSLPEVHEPAIGPQPPAQVREKSVRQAGRTGPANTADAKRLYKDAYSHMLRRDYGSAEAAFSSLIRNHPKSRMAGNAQYWLGETHYVRGQYRKSADAFLKSYREYPNGVKAPDSLMKLALSLSRLGQKDAACKTFRQLEGSYPNAPSHVKQRAGMEQRRAGCD